MYSSNIKFIGLFTVAMLVISPMAQARILADDEAAQAATSALQDEAKLFSTIRMGIALSMAQCQGRELCTPTVNAAEVRQLLDTLDTRIEDLTLKQESVEDPEAFQEVLALYVGERDNLSHVLQQLGTVEQAIEDVGVEAGVETFEEPTFEETLTDDSVTGEPAEAAIADEDLEFFEDADLELEDDEDLEFEDDFDPEAVESGVQ
ncbi:MAG: hypothetical protein MI673_04315 [Thiotrichales bacterium]|nr:hypothetical protein [Thiotrichales bacterium]